MLLNHAFICPSCQLARLTFIPTVSFPTTTRCLQWQSTRSYAQFRSKQRPDQRRPTRMTLSPNVAKPPSSAKRSPSSPSFAIRKGHGPWAAMNRTTIPPDLPPRRQSNPSRHGTLPKKSSPLAKSRSKGRPEKRERDSGDMKALKMQRALTSIGYGKRSAVKATITEIDSFRQFPLLPAILDSIPSEALKGLVDITPTPIQRLAIPALLSQQTPRPFKTPRHTLQQSLLAAETGSGKTLAYLLPTIDAVKRAELAEAENQPPRPEPAQPFNPLALEAPPLSINSHLKAGRPRAIVLVPTAELVEQVGQVFKAFSHTLKMRVALISAAYSATVIRNRLFKDSGIDIVIATPHLLGSIAQSDPHILAGVNHLIVDEADSLFDQSFGPITSEIVDRATPTLKQLILCSATIPRSLDMLCRKRFPQMLRLTTPNLHAIPRRVQLTVMDINNPPYQGNRDLACADAIWQTANGLDSETGFSEAKRMIVFVNEREKAVQVAAYLVTKGIDAVALNRDTKEQRSEAILSAFTTTSPEPVSGDQSVFSHVPNATTSPSRPASRRILHNVKVLVMTDLGSRGIDTVAVRNLVLYDVPHTSVDFIHRLGRLGRMGRRGRAVVLVGKDDRKDVVREVRAGMFRGQALI